MALVIEMTQKTAEKRRIHGPVECTYSFVPDDIAGQCFQIETYGSKTSETPNKVHQTIRFAPKAIEQLKVLLQKHF